MLWPLNQGKFLNLYLFINYVLGISRNLGLKVILILRLWKWDSNNNLQFFMLIVDWGCVRIMSLIEHATRRLIEHVPDLSYVEVRIPEHWSPIYMKIIFAHPWFCFIWFLIAVWYLVVIRYILICLVYACDYM